MTYEIKIEALEARLFDLETEVMKLQRADGYREILKLKEATILYSEPDVVTLEAYTYMTSAQKSAATQKHNKWWNSLSLIEKLDRFRTCQRNDNSNCLAIRSTPKEKTHG